MLDIKQYATRPTFDNGGIPISIEGVQSQIRLTRQQGDRVAYPILKSAESGLDKLTLELCADERRQGKRLEDWLIKAELEAFIRSRKGTL